MAVNVIVEGGLGVTIMDITASEHDSAGIDLDHAMFVHGDGQVGSIL